MFLKLNCLRKFLIQSILCEVVLVQKPNHEHSFICYNLLCIRFWWKWKLEILLFPKERKLRKYSSTFKNSIALVVILFLTIICIEIVQLIPAISFSWSHTHLASWGLPRHEGNPPYLYLWEKGHHHALFNSYNHLRVRTRQWISLQVQPHFIGQVPFPNYIFAECKIVAVSNRCCTNRYLKYKESKLTLYRD